MDRKRLVIRLTILVFTLAIFFSVLTGAIPSLRQDSTFATPTVKVDAIQENVSDDNDAIETYGAQEEALLEKEINEIIQNNPEFDIAVSVKNIEKGLQYDYGDDAVFVAASTTKLITAMTYYHLVENGTYSLGKEINGVPAETLLKAMIEESDNNSWHELDSLIGVSRLESFAAASGASSFNASANTISAHDMTAIISALYEGRLLNEINRITLLGYMNRANYDYLIHSGVPSTAIVYHKAGLLDDRVLDTAVIDFGSQTFVITVFAKGPVTEVASQGVTIIRLITETLAGN